MVDWIPVHSSWLDAYYYDRGTLFVRFKNKSGRGAITCMYEDVPIDLWTGLLEAPSKGTYFHQSGLINWTYTLI